MDSRNFALKLSMPQANRTLKRINTRRVILFKDSIYLKAFIIVISCTNGSRFVGNEFKIEFYKLLKVDGMTVPISRSIEAPPSLLDGLGFMAKKRKWTM